MLSLAISKAATVDSTAEVRSLTGLRAVLAWWVVAFHFGRRFIPDDWPALRGAISGGHVAVDIFFVLSGFVLMRRYGETNFTRPAISAFYRKRFARVYPLYATSLALGALAMWPRFLEDCASAMGWTRFVLEAFLLNAWTHHAMFQYNFAAWSLSVEAFFYLLCPWILPLMARTSTRALGILLALACLSTLVAPSIYAAIDPDHLGRAVTLDDDLKGTWYLKFFPVQRLPEFVAGAAIARIGWNARPAAHLAAIALVALLALGVVPYAYLVCGALLPIIVVLVAGVAAWDTGPMTSSACVALGKASFATYILHWPLFLLWSRWDRSVWERPAHFFAFAAALVVVSLLVFRFVEDPLRRRLAAPARS
jgi:peptidoglycan/LPS O-acetylase OafA/YrhL